MRLGNLAAEGTVAVGDRGIVEISSFLTSHPRRENA